MEDIHTLDENYTKSLIAMKIAKQGLHNFVLFGIEEFREKTLTDIRNENQLDQDAVCSSCEINDISPCPTKGICSYGKCRVHGKKHKPNCKNDICDEFQQRIRYAHDRKRPWFKNIVAKRFCIKGDWELAKCFMPEDDGNTTSGPEDTDFSGLLTIIVNCTPFRKLCQDIGMFKEARKRRNHIIHTKDYRLEKNELDKFIDVLMKLLADPVWLVKCQKAKEAISALTKLKLDDLENRKSVNEEAKEQAEKEYALDKRRFQSSLISYYEENLVLVPVCPGLPDEDTLNVEEMYVLQNLEAVASRPVDGKEEPPKRLDTYEKLFTKNDKLCKDIYIKGSAGIGKTVLCQKLISQWCKSKKEASDDLVGDKFIGTFDFVFPIKLRHVGKNVSKVVTMVTEQLLEEFQWFEDLFMKVVQDKDIKCLFVLDGLDEWLPPDGFEYDTPDRRSIKHCSFLTFCRPWKYEVLRVKNTCHKQIVSIREFDDTASSELVHKVVDYLNNRFGRNREAAEFIRLLNRPGRDSLKRVPVILKQLICMWSDEKTVVSTKSLCIIYSKMIEFLLGIFDRKQSANLPRQPHDTHDATKLPKCFSKHRNCHKHEQILKDLSKLAFYASFESDQTLSLVFECGSEEENAVISTERKEICLNSGLLSQDVITRKATTKHRKLSFTHKSFHDFFVALYIATCPPSEKNHVREQVQKVCNTTEKVLAMESMFIFLSGLNPDAMRTIADHIPDIVDRHERTETLREQFERGLEHQNPLKMVQDMLLRCFKECAENKFEPKCMAVRCDDVYVDRSTMRDPLLSDLVSINANYVKNLRIHVPVHEDHDLRKDLKKALWTCNNLKYVHVYMNKRFTREDTMQLISESHEGIVCLNLRQHGDASHGGMPFLWSNWEKLRSIQILRLEHMTIHCSHVQKIMHLLKKREPSIRRLHLRSLHCYEHSPCQHGYTLDAAKFRSAEKVYVKDTSIRVDNMFELSPDDSCTSISSLNVSDDRQRTTTESRYRSESSSSISSCRSEDGVHWY